MANTNSMLTFNPKSYSIENLLNYIETGEIALPELQRPFVWNNIKARDLIDSLYKGLPVGLIILWEVHENNRHNPINPDSKTDPKYLVVDGQQRLTTLFSIVKNSDIVSKSGRNFKIKIAFNPIEEKFEVCNPAIEKDTRWISDISEIFVRPSTHSFINEYVRKLKEKGIDFNENVVSSRIERLKNIITYPFSIMELSTELDPEEVSEIFVRINSKGQKLNQSDFILTLMSVYWPEGRKEIEKFCKESYKASEKPSSYNPIKITPAPENLIRSIVGLAFNRGRLKYAYLTLKGRDFENKVIDENLRIENFKQLQVAQEKVLNLTNWHDYIKVILSAGFVNENLISSKIAFFINYSFYLIGKEYGIDYKELESYIRKWFVMTLLTQRYTSSPESQIEEDLKNLTKANYLYYINDQIRVNLTEDFWNIQLPGRLRSSSTINYAYLTYVASHVRDGTKVLFSQIYLRDYLNPLFKAKKKITDTHHIFPRATLKRQNYNRKEINQVANFLYLEYKDNIKIKDKHPREYFPELANEYENGDFERLYAIYDLPPNFWEMDYEQFLEVRRQLMAKRLKVYFESL